MKNALGWVLIAVSGFTLLGSVFSSHRLRRIMDAVVGLLPLVIPVMHIVFRDVDSGLVPPLASPKDSVAVDRPGKLWALALYITPIRSCCYPRDTRGESTVWQWAPSLDL